MSTPKPSEEVKFETSPWRLLPASHDLRGLDSAHSWSFFGEEVCFRTESAFYPWSAVFSLHFYPQSAFYPWSAVCVLHWPHLKLLDGNSTIDYISSVFFGFTSVFGHIIVLKRHESKRVSSPTLEKKFYRVNGNNYEWMNYFFRRNSQLLKKICLPPSSVMHDLPRKKRFIFLCRSVTHRWPL